MHYVDRGPEPPKLKGVRDKLTPKWVAFYRARKGKKPGDSRWREFQPSLAIPFRELCGYCEEPRKGDVDHFRPKSRDPELVYQWSNWVYACHDCNGKKSDLWPTVGYVDPCATKITERPESYLDFDLLTAEIIPRDGLKATRRRRAVQMIRDLDLNSTPHRKNRSAWVAAFNVLVEGRPPTHPLVIASVAKMTAPDHPNCGILRKAARDAGLV